MSENVKVSVKNLTKSFGDLLVLDDISFDVKQGEFLCIVGPTGCGKTTFLNSLTKLYDIDKGTITLNGEAIDPKKQNKSEWLDSKEQYERRPAFYLILRN